MRAKRSKNVFTRAELQTAAERSQKREIPNTTFGNALHRGIEEGKIVRLKWGKYGPKKTRARAGATRSRRRDEEGWA